MDVKACDICKKTNLETTLIAFYEYRQGDPKNELYRQSPDSPLIGFTVQQLVPAYIASEDFIAQRPLKLFCKPCCEGRAKEIIAAL